MQLLQLAVRAALLAALLVATADALFTPRCLWSGLLGDLGSSSSEESGERWLRDTSFRTKDSRVRRFLWTDRDVCDWMCKGDYGSEVREVCRRCCPGSAATSKRPLASSTATATPSTAATSRAPRSTVSDGTTVASTAAAASSAAADASPTAAGASTGAPAPAPAPAQTPA